MIRILGYVRNQTQLYLLNILDTESNTQMPIVNIYTDLPDGRDPKPFPLNKVINVANTDTLREWHRKRTKLRNYLKSGGECEPNDNGVKVLKQLPYFCPPMGTAVVRIVSESWSYLDIPMMMGYVLELPYIGAYMGNQDDREVIVFAKAPTTHETYNEYLGKFVDDLHALNFVGHIMPVFSNTSTEIPYDGEAWVTNNWDELESLTLPENYAE